jgi:hypothetical protein
LALIVDEPVKASLLELTHLPPQLPQLLLLGAR